MRKTVAKGIVAVVSSPQRKTLNKCILLIRIICVEEIEKRKGWRERYLAKEHHLPVSSDANGADTTMLCIRCVVIIKSKVCCAVRWECRAARRRADVRRLLKSVIGDSSQLARRCFCLRWQYKAGKPGVVVLHSKAASAAVYGCCL